METYLVRPIIPIVNRRLKKEFINEITVVVTKLNKVEHDFVDVLFDERESDDYKTLYTRYQLEWNKTVKQALSVCKLCAINKEYFKQAYQPIN